MTRTRRDQQVPCTIDTTAQTPTGDAEPGRAHGAEKVKAWWATIFRLVDKPDVAARIFRAHEPNEAGLCEVCASPGDARNLPWPCTTHAMAENALVLRAQRNRAERADYWPLRRPIKDQSVEWVTN